MAGSRSVGECVDAVPVVDVGPYLDGSDPDGVARQIDDACRRIGFLIIAGHQIDEDLISDMERATLEFFHRPLAAKSVAAPPRSDVFRGFRAASASALAKSLGVDSPPDLVESFVVNRPGNDGAAPTGLPAGYERFYHPNIWPPASDGLREVWTRYYQAMSDLCRRLMRVCALALGLEEAWFDDKFEHHRSNLLANYYPPQLQPPEPNQLRRGAHTDYGGLTVLYSRDPSGLQVRSGESWRDVPHVPGAFVVNIGDLLERWTNDRWVSTLHRVINPPPSEAGSERLSIPFFHIPNLDLVVDCIPTCVSDADPCRAEPVVAGDWFLGKHLKTIETTS